MSQKFNPIGMRIGTFLPWKSRWYSEGINYRNFLLEDYKIRKTMMERLKLAGIVSVEIERLPKSLVVYLTVSRPGVVIGRGGGGIEDVKNAILTVLSAARGVPVSTLRGLKIDPRVSEVKNPEISAYLVAQRVVGELERRIPQRRVVTKAMERVMASGAKGIKIVLAGRIGGAEISRVEKYHLGSVPTQTLREEIDYAEVPALLKRGYVGVKVWIHKEKGEND